jgi:HlyD family secretion protein
VKSWRTWLRVFIAAIVTLAIGFGLWIGAKWFRQVQAATEIPVATARQGEFLVVIRSRGEVKAERSVPIYAPVVPNLTIAWMSPPGEPVEEGKPLIRFDSSSAQQQLVQKEAALKQAEAALDQAVAQAKITAEHDQSDLTDAQYNLEKAKLQTVGNEFVSRIQLEQAKVEVGVAEQKVKVLEANIALHAASDKAKIASLTRQRDQAQADVNLTKSRIEQMEIRSPISGFAVFAPNYNQGPLNARPFRVGDTVYSGMSLAEMPDMTSLVMDVKVEETDRGQISIGKDVRVHIDALPELTVEAQITGISPLAELSLEYPPTRSFRAYAALKNPDSRLRPGMNGGMDIVISRIAQAISIPGKAVFTRNGKPIVYTVQNGAYTPANIELLARNPDDAAVSGIAGGTLVALSDPEKAQRK